jgi:hypothetical protein
MAVTVTHPFVSLVADGGDTTVVQPTNWNATHSLTGTVDVANGGTGASTASITSFNNITGYTAAGATGTTSTNLVFSASPTFTGTLGAAAITASTTLGVTGNSTLTGRVGIGGDPEIGVTLNVADSSGICQIRVLESASGVDTRIYSSGGLAGVMGTFSNHPLIFFANLDEKMRIDSAGTVSIASTTEQSGTTGAMTVAGGVYIAKKLTAIGGISGGTF